MRQEFRDVRLDRLKEEREHLKIRINLLEHNGTATDASIAAVRQELAELERSIADHRPRGPA